MVSRPVGGVLSRFGRSRTLCGHLSVRPTWRWLSPDGTPVPHAWPCSRWGLPSCHSHLRHWCALTAPFHPYLCSRGSHRRFALCCTCLRVTTTGR